MSNLCWRWSTLCFLPVLEAQIRTKVGSGGSRSHSSFFKLVFFLIAQVLTAPTESCTHHFTNSRYVMLNHKIKVIWPFVIYENDHFVWFSLASRLTYMYMFGEHGALSNINLQKELDFLKSPMWREQSSNSWEKILICASCMVLAGIEIVRTAAGLIDVLLVSMASASLMQPCRCSVHQLLGHWWPSTCFFVILFPSHTPKEGDGRKWY